MNPGRAALAGTSRSCTSHTPSASGRRGHSSEPEPPPEAGSGLTPLRSPGPTPPGVPFCLLQGPGCASCWLSSLNLSAPHPLSSLTSVQAPAPSARVRSVNTPPPFAALLCPTGPELLLISGSCECGHQEPSCSAPWGTGERLQGPGCRLPVAAPLPAARGQAMAACRAWGRACASGHSDGPGVSTKPGNRAPLRLADSSELPG